MVKQVVRALSDGRGAARPFGTFSKAQYGEHVYVGDRSIPVAKDGRLIIPKSIMEEYGTPGPDGRNRIVIDFSSSPSDRTGKREYAARVILPTKEDLQSKTGDKPKRTKIRRPTDRLMPSDSPDMEWSALADAV